MQEGTFEWYKAIFNSLLKTDMKNFQNQKDCYDLLLNMKIDLKFDDKQIKNYALKISQYTHKMADYMAGMTGNGQFDELYWNLLLFEAPDLLDSYCLYVEKDRKPQERFYQPRRKTLIKVVNLLQRLEDDELDEAFIHMPARVGKLISDDTPVFTKDGWKRHGELKLGDKVVGSDGKYTSVICVHPKYHTTHTVEFSDGTKIECHFRHEWTVYDSLGKRWITTETKNLIKSQTYGFFKERYFLPIVSTNLDLKVPLVQEKRSIKSIRKSNPKQGNCITVSNSDGLYLVGKTMIPTHNTQIITLGMSWHCCRNTEKSNLYCSYKEDAGGAFLDGVKEIWTDPIYRHADVFPKAQIVDTDAKANTIDLERKKKYKSLSGKGLTSGLNGLYDANGWLVADDILSGIEDVLSPDVLARKQMLFDNNLMKRKKEQCKVLYNGTIWSLHDIYMDRVNFLETDPEAKDVRWEVLKIPALDPETDESNFDYDYGVGFSTKYYRMERAKFEANDDMASWFSQCQQEPIERDGAVFNPEHMNFYNGVLPDEIPLKIVAACDVALGGTDFLSMPVAYVYEDGSVYIHDVVFDSSEKSVTQPKVVDCLIRNNVTNSFFEANNGGEGYKDDIDRLLKERGHKINLVSKFAQQMIVNAGKGGSKTAQRKEQRIWDNAQTIRSFYFRDSGHQSLEYRKFMNQLYSFTVNGKNKHDDSPDSLAELAVFLNKGSGTQTTQVVSSPFGRRR